ncbi:unnamed protein product, partial [Rotaria sp. Silwood2]
MITNCEAKYAVLENFQAPYCPGITGKPIVYIVGS